MLKLAILSSLLLLGATDSPSQGPKPSQDQQTKQAKKVVTCVVIVNAKNTSGQSGLAAKATIKKLFLKQLKKWPDGSSARPYGRKQGSAEHRKFIKNVLGMGDAELARHWLKMKNMTGTTPPKGVSSSRMILKYVAKHRGALGVVKLSDVKTAKGIKVLYRF